VTWSSSHLFLLCCSAQVCLDNTFVLRAISSVDRPFESDGEAPPPPDDAESSSAHSSHEYMRQNQQQHSYNEHGQYYHHNAQQQHYNQQPEPESLSVFKRGIRDLAARHRKTGGLASQRLVASRLNAAAISLQVGYDCALV